MRKTLQLTTAFSLAATLALAAPAMAQHWDDHHHDFPHHDVPHHDDHRGGPPHMHSLGERGYSFRGPGGVRREIGLFSPREREFWTRGRWHHEMRFGRMGYWYEVNGAWYFYDRPFEGPPAYVSEVEFFDPGLEGPAVVVAPPPAVVVVPPPPPVVCVGPLCVR